MTLCLPVTGSSTYCERLLPSTRMRWLAGADCPAERGRRFREMPAGACAPVPGASQGTRASQWDSDPPAALMHPGHLSQQPCSPFTCGHRHPRPQAELAGHGTGEGDAEPTCQPLASDLPPPGRRPRASPLLPGWGAGRWAQEWVGQGHSPSLKSRPSSWLGQRFTTSVTCSAFL